MRIKRFIGASATGSLLSLCMVGSGYAGNWLGDPVSDCKVWSETKTENEISLTWSGACHDDKATGEGVLVTYDANGLLLTYKGQMLDGKVHGSGYMQIRNDESGGFDEYLGMFRDHAPAGEGIYLSSEGWVLKAEFDGDFNTGTGTLHIFSETEDVKDSMLRGQFKGGELQGPALAFYETESGEAYFGEVENGKRAGFGTLVHANNDTYVGSFVDGVASGYGNYQKTDGSMMIGIYKSGAPNGPGSYIAPNGDAYQGVFVNGKPEGKILVTSKDGNQVIEMWKNGEKQE